MEHLASGDKAHLKGQGLVVGGAEVDVMREDHGTAGFQDTVNTVISIDIRDTCIGKERRILIAGSHLLPVGLRKCRPIFIMGKDRTIAVILHLLQRHGVVGALYHLAGFFLQSQKCTDLRCREPLELRIDTVVRRKRRLSFRRFRRFCLFDRTRKIGRRGLRIFFRELAGRKGCEHSGCHRKDQ